MTTTARVLDELSQVAIQLLLREPFYAHVFSSLNKTVVGPGHEVDTLAVGQGANGYTFYVNAKFWDEELTSPEHRYGVVKHEILHLVFRHHAAQDPAFDAMVQNIAFDLVVNQYIDRKMLPENSIFLETFPDLKLWQGQTWFYYYKKLAEARQQSGDGNPSGTPSADILEKMSSTSNGLERHQPWREIRNKSNLEKSVNDAHMDNVIRTAHQRTSAAAWGALPGEVRDTLQQTLQAPEPEVNWRRTLRVFTKSASLTTLRSTIRRPSKRYGTNPGVKIQRKQRLLVALDTSGSIGTPDVQLFFDELYHLWRTGVQIDVVECDTKIQRRYPYRGAIPQFYFGRGGTDFNEPLVLANEERPDALIYFTDGYAGKPITQPRIPVLWMITSRGIVNGTAQWQDLPGRKVKMKRG